MRATNKSSSASFTPISNQSVASTETTPAFVYLYDKAIDPNSIKFCTRLAKNTHLKTYVLEFDTAKASIAAVSQHLSVCKGTANHLLLHVHGYCTGSKGERTHRFVTNSSADSVNDYSTREWLENLLCKSSKAPHSQNNVRPFVHVLSCHAKALADEIKPHTKLWKSGWFILYSSSKVTSVNHFANSFDVTASYLDLCESRNTQADPFTLFYLAGLARGDCMTLLGGDLQQPLTLHAPKSLRDLEHMCSLKLCEGSPLDKSRLLLAGIELSSQERSLLSDTLDEPHIIQLLAARIERRDENAIKVIVQDKPQLLNRLHALGTLPLASAVKNHSQNLLSWMFSKGAKINATDCDGDTLLFYAITHEDTVMLDFLLSSGANPNCPNHNSVTPLIATIEHNNTDAAELLIEYDADLLWTDKGDTALTLAVSKGQLSVVKCLLQHGADRRAGLSENLVQQARTAQREDIALLLEQALQKQPTWKNTASSHRY